jgi:mannose-1-phosphate guanylyltransferase
MPQAVIMAGGAGTRLWPLSRATRPKQLLHLLGGQSLLRKSFERLRGLVPPKDIYVITGAPYIPQVGDELPEIPRENLIGEPVGRDTANAVGLAAAILHHRDPHGVMGIFTADHVIRPVDRFTDAVKAGFAAAEENPEALVTFGIRVRRPETAFGYVRRGEQVGPGVYVVDEFAEKPDAPTAERYAASTDYFWTLLQRTTFGTAACSRGARPRFWRNSASICRVRTRV